MDFWCCCLLYGLFLQTFNRSMGWLLLMRRTCRLKIFQKLSFGMFLVIRFLLFAAVSQVIIMQVLWDFVSVQSMHSIIIGVSAVMSYSTIWKWTMHRFIMNLRHFFLSDRVGGKLHLLPLLVYWVCLWRSVGKGRSSDCS
jgi:hypothetical protein